MSAQTLPLRSGLVAYLDPALLPDDLVESLAASGAIVVAKASGPAATLHLTEDGRIGRIERADASVLEMIPEGAEVVDLETRRLERARAKVRGAMAASVALAPVVALMPPLVRLSS